MIGGLLWIAFYVTSILLGGGMRDELPLAPGASALGLLSVSVFSGALVFIATALLLLHARYEGRAGWQGRVAWMLACLVLTVVTVQWVLMLGVIGQPIFVPPLGAVGVLSICGSAALLGVAGRRVSVLPRSGNRVLLAIGALTMVLVILSTLRYGSVPAYLVDDLPFGIAGVAWIFVGVAMRR